MEPNSAIGRKIGQNSIKETERVGNGDGGSKLDDVKLAFERAKAYKKPAEPNSSISISEQNPVQKREVPISVKIAMERAKKYKQNDEGVVSTSGKDALSGLKGGNGVNLGNANVEKRVRKKEEPTISSIDFMGLGFTDKKQGRGLPAGLIPMVDSFPQGDLPEVELIVGDLSKFGGTTPSNLKPAQEESSDLYEPKVSTWGVFPRPSNISKTFGGGRVVRPGEVLETVEDKAAKEKRTRQLLAAYKKKVGLNIDAKLKSECEKAMKDGDSLMDLGKLKEALPFYEKVMDKLPFQSELHGLAALQWSICQDSLSRLNEARVMYERLQSHPNVQVSKKARHFVFGFQAMEMMRVTSSSSSSKNMGYQNYFEAFIEDKGNYPVQDTEVEEDALTQSIPYILFLALPIFIILLIAVQKQL